ncbi:MAG TPA: hypothetical protein VFH31_01020 [Pyrinomonadaceae bacterium]|nr:hypothetical protein [Pyrinomonadaceae bacterium]
MAPLKVPARVCLSKLSAKVVIARIAHSVSLHGQLRNTCAYCLFPNEATDHNMDGYNFWLQKLNHFGGNFVQAEMVKAFISSIEYRSRFGP